VGSFDGATCQVASGWACDQNNWGATLPVHIYGNGPAGVGIFLGQVTANGSRPDVAPVCGGTTAHGWTFTIPASLKDGNSHTLYSYAIGLKGINPLLPVSPKTILCALPPTATITKTTNACGTNAQTFQVTANAGKGASGVTAEVYVTNATNTAPPSNCPAANRNGNWCLIARSANAANTYTFPVTWTPPDKAKYIAEVAAYNGVNTGFVGGQSCAGNIFFNGWDPVNGWAQCSTNNTNSAVSWTPVSCPPKGSHDSADCKSFVGWACDDTNYSQALAVHFYTDNGGVSNKFETAGTANQPAYPGADTTAIAAQCGGFSSHRFNVPLPDDTFLFDRQAHKIYAYGIGLGGVGNPLLTNSPKTISCAPENPTATVSRSGNACYEQTNTFTLSATRGKGSGPNVKIELLVNIGSAAECTSTGGTPTTIAGNPYCIIYSSNTYKPSPLAPNPQPTWTPLVPRAYTVFVRAYNDGQTGASADGKCSGGPDGWPSCGPNDHVTFTADSTGTCAQPWMKLKDASFNSKFTSGNKRLNIIPFGIQAFDSEDSGGAYTLDNTALINPGVILGLKQIDQGVIAKTNYSSSNWVKFDYPNFNSQYSPSNYRDYILAKKRYNTVTHSSVNISSTHDFDDPVSGIYYWEGGLNIDTTPNFGGNTGQQRSILIYVNGPVVINTSTNTFSPPNNVSIGIVSADPTNGLQISQSMSQIRALLVGEKVTDYGSANPGTTPLKIKGNLISNTEYNLNRVNSAYNLPGMFMVFDPSLYINLLPYFSVATYQWEELE
jgi:hypothetical protein